MSVTGTGQVVRKPSVAGATFTAEVSPPVVPAGAGNHAITWTAYYGKTGSAILALPTGVGLSTNNTTFTCTIAGAFSIFASLTIHNAPASGPGHAAAVVLRLPDYGGRPKADITASGPNQSAPTIGRYLWMNVGDTFDLAQSGTSGDQVVDYATMTVVRLSA